MSHPRASCDHGTPLSMRYLKSRSFLPVSWPVILQELPPHVFAGVDAADDRIDDARSAVNNVQRWVETFFQHFLRCQIRRILVGHPAGVDAVHVDAVVVV